MGTGAAMRARLCGRDGQRGEPDRHSSWAGVDARQQVGDATVGVKTAFDSTPVRQSPASRAGQMRMGGLLAWTNPRAREAAGGGAGRRSQLTRHSWRRRSDPQLMRLVLLFILRMHVLEALLFDLAVKHSHPAARSVRFVLGEAVSILRDYSHSPLLVAMVPRHSAMWHVHP